MKSLICRRMKYFLAGVATMRASPQKMSSDYFRSYVFDHAECGRLEQESSSAD